jgi:hypothetical protein
MADNDHHDRDPLLSLRTAVLLLLSLLAGAGAGGLTVLAGGHVAYADRLGGPNVTLARDSRH